MKFIKYILIAVVSLAMTPDFVQCYAAGDSFANAEALVGDLSANSIDVNDSIISGDKHYYQVTIPGDGYLVMSGGGELTTQVTLWESEESVLAKSTSMGGAQHLSLSELLVAGDYVFSASSLVEGEIGNYGISISFAGLSNDGSDSFLEAKLQLHDLSVSALVVNESLGYRDADFYAVATPAEGHLKIELNSSYNAEIVLLSGSATEIGSSSDSRLVKLVDGGEYTVVVRGENGAEVASYSLNASYFPPVEDGNDTEKTADVLVGTPGTTPLVENSDLAYGDYDYWKFAVVEAGFYSIETTGDLNTSGRLYHVEGDGFAYLTNASSGGTGSNFKISRFLPVGEYVQRVSGSSDSLGAYVLQIQKETDNLLSNDFIGGPVSENVTIQSDIRKIYRFEVVEPGEYAFYSEGPVDTAAELYHSKGEQLFYSLNGGVGNNFRANSFLGVGSYYIVLSGRYGETGESNLFVAYEEPVLVAEDLTQGSVTYNGLGYYEFVSPGSGYVKLSFPSASGRLYGYLYDENGDLLEEDSGYYSSFSIYRKLEAGTYFVGYHSNSSVSNDAIQIEYFNEVDDGNNSIVNAVELTGDLTAASIVHSDTLEIADRDYFEFNLSQGGYVGISRSSNYAGAVLYDSIGDTIVSHLDSSKSDDEIFEYLEAGSYYVRIQSSDASRLVNYDLSITLNAAYAPIHDSFESAIELAGDIATAPVSHSSYIAEGKSAYFKFVVPEFGLVRLDVSMDGYFFPNGRVLDSSKNEVEMHESGSYEVYGVLKSGTYFFELNGSDFSSAETYTLSVSLETPIHDSTDLNATAIQTSYNFSSGSLATISFSVPNDGTLDLARLGRGRAVKADLYDSFGNKIHSQVVDLGEDFDFSPSVSSGGYYLSFYTDYVGDYEFVVSFANSSGDYSLTAPWLGTIDPAILDYVNLHKLNEDEAKSLEEKRARQFATENVLVNESMPIGPIATWLRPEELDAYEDGETVSTWSTISGYADFESFGTTPSLYLDESTGIKGVSFGTGDVLESNFNHRFDSDSVTVFAVYSGSPVLESETLELEMGRLYDSGSYYFDVKRGVFYDPLWNNPLLETDVAKTVIHTYRDQSSTFSSQWVNGLFQGNAEDRIGALGKLRFAYGNGRVSELIVYERALSDEEVKTVEKYLSDKYGIYHPKANWLDELASEVVDKVHEGQLDRTFAQDLQLRLESQPVYNQFLADHGMPTGPIATWLRLDEVAEDYLNGDDVIHWRQATGYSGLMKDEDDYYHNPPEFVADTGEASNGVLFRGDQLNSEITFDSVDQAYTLFVAYEAISSGEQNVLNAGDDWWPHFSIGYPRVKLNEEDIFTASEVLDSRKRIQSFLLNADNPNNRYAMYWENGELVGTKLESETSSGFSSLNRLFIGSPNEAYPGLRAYVKEVLVYERSLSLEEIESVNDYLVGKYGYYSPNAQWMLEFDPDVRDIIHSLKLDRKAAQDLLVFRADLDAYSLPLGPLYTWLRPEELAEEYDEGDAVAFWPAAGGSTQFSAGSTNPTYRSDTSSGYAGVSFDNVDDNLRDSRWFTSDEPVTVFAVYRALSSDNTVSVLSSQYSNRWRMGATDMFSDNYGVSIASSSPLPINDPVSFDSERFVAQAYRYDPDGYIHSSWVNGLYQGNEGGRQISIGNIGLGDLSRYQEANAVVSELLIYDRALSDQEIGDVNKYLADKYGLYAPNADWVAALPASVKTVVDSNRLDRHESLPLMDLMPSLSLLSRNDILAWYTADQLTDGGSVWLDSSGERNHARQSSVLFRPSRLDDHQNLRPVAMFSSSSVSTRSVNPTTAGMEVFYVLRSVKESGNNNTFGNYSSTSSATYYPSAAGAIVDSFASTTTHTFTPEATIDLGEFQIYNASSIPGEWSARINGVEQGNDAVNSVLSTARPFTIGSNSFEGDIAEIIVFDRSLTVEERFEVDTYLINKYGVGNVSLAPVSLSVQSGEYYPSVDIEVTTTEADVDIYYTLDGSRPHPDNPNAALFMIGGSITVSNTATLKVVAYDQNSEANPSPLVKADYDIVAPVGTGNGLLGQFYDEADAFSGVARFQRIDSTVNIDFSGDAKVGEIFANSDHFGVRWIGVFETRYAEEYIFYVSADDSVRLYIDDVLVVDGWGSFSSVRTLESAPINLAFGPHDIRLEYIDYTGQNSALLEWSSSSTSREIVPTAQLYSGYPSKPFAERVEFNPSSTPFSGSIDVEMTSSTPGAEIRYTLNGNDPSETSSLYTGPIRVTSTRTIKASVFDNDGSLNPSLVNTATYTSDEVPPSIDQIDIDSSALSNGTVISGKVVLSANASDDNGVGSIEFRLIDVQGLETFLNRELFSGGSTGSVSSQLVFDAISYEDGGYTLKVIVEDRAGAITTEQRALTLTLGSPSAPAVTTPTASSINKSQSVTVSGSAPRADTISLYEGGALLGSAPVGGDGNYSLLVNFSDGPHTIHAIAHNRGGQSVASSEVTFEVNSLFPPKPLNLSVTSEPGGHVSVRWNTPSFNFAISGYRVYRRVAGTNDWTLVSGSDPLTDSVFSDEDTADGVEYEYRVDSIFLFTDQTERPSDEAISTVIAADSSSPSFSIRILSAERELTENDSTRYGSGTLEIELMSTEPLSNIPYLGYSKGAGIPFQVNLRSVASTKFEGSILVDGSISSGLYVAQVRANDIAGNLGESVTVGSELHIDTSAPSVVALSNTPSTVQNSIDGGTGLGTLQQFTLTLDEEPTEDPIARIHLPGKELTELANVTDAGDEDPLTWFVEYNFPALAGNPVEEILELSIEASDGLGNANSDIPVISYLVYQGELPALPSPDNLAATAFPAGAVQLSWDTVSGAYGYHVYIEPINEPGSVQSVSTLVGIDNTSLSHTPSEDGEYLYYVSSIRDVNGQQSESDFAAFAVVTADRISSNPPVLNSLLSTANGVDISWSRPLDSVGDTLQYSVYRSSNSDFSDLDLVTRIRSGLDTLAHKDSRPDSGNPYYAVVAVDAAGNHSVASNTEFLNVALLPVNDLSVMLEEGQAPTLVWASVAAATGYNVYAGLEGSEALLNTGGPITDLSWTDISFLGGERRYAVESVIEDGENTYYSYRRGVTLPEVSMQPNGALELAVDFPSKLAFDLEIGNPDVSSYWGALQLLDGNDDLIGQTVAANLSSTAKNDLAVVATIDEELAGEEDILPLLVIATMETPTDEKVVYTKKFDASIVTGGLVSEIEVLGQAIRGADCRLVLSVTNTSEVPIDFVVAEGQSDPSQEARVLVSDSNGTVYVNSPIRLVNNITQVIGTAKRVARVQPGATYKTEDISISLPANLPPVVTVSVVVDQFYYAIASVSEVRLPGTNAEATVSTIEPSYSTRIVSLSENTTDGEQPIIVNGEAFRMNNGSEFLQASVPVTISVKKGEATRRYETYTDNAGSFSFEYIPYPDDSGGLYEVWAHHPEVTASPDQGDVKTFTLQKLEVLVEKFSIKVPRLYEYAFTVKLKTEADLEFNNLRLEIHPESIVPADVSLVLPDPILVANGGRVELPVTISGLEPGTLDASSFRLQVVSDESMPGQNLGDVTINYSFSSAYRSLSSEVSLLQLGVGLEENESSQVIGASDDLISLELVNTGLLPLASVKLDLLQQSDGSPAPAWVSISGDGVIESLYVNERSQVDLQTNVTGMLNTPSVPVPGIYHLYLRATVEEEIDSLFEVPVIVTVSETGSNSRAFRLMNAFFNYDADLLDGRDPTTEENRYFNGVAGARVTLEPFVFGEGTNSWIPPEAIEMTSDSSGRVDFQDLATGEYKLRVDIEGHDSFSERIFVKPGITYAEEAVALNYRAVSVQWEVVPVTIEDRYDIYVETTYETDVPTPVLIIEPAILEVPDLCPGDVFTAEVSMRNEGLVAAKNIANPFLEPDPYFDVEIVSDTPPVFDVPAGREVRIVFRMTCIKPLPGSECDSQEN